MERKYVWLDTQEKDTFAEFKDEFNYVGGKAVLNITSDWKFAAFVNGTIVGNSQFADIPEYKTFSEYDITNYLTEGKNTLVVKAYHMGTEYFVCRSMTPCVSYEINVDGKCVCVSSEDTLCRKDPRYAHGALFSKQMGDGYNYTFVSEETPWVKSTVVNPDFKEVSKPIKNTHLNSKRDCTVIAQGVYRFNGGESAAEKMQRSFIYTLPAVSTMNKRESKVPTLPITFASDVEGDGLFVLGDLGCECAGFPFFEIECEDDTVAYLGWGEHLADLRPRVQIEYRHFAVEIKLKKGKNNFAEYIKRIGARYMCLYVASKKIQLNTFGLIEELYPLEKPEKDFGDKLLNKIYEVGRRTLELCMHEHYEDCPWREQALYGMDSRNQMLFGYGAFKEYQFPRASLTLIGKCLRKDGLIPICAPSTDPLVIPSFSAYWILAICDNAKVDCDMQFLKDILPSAERCLQAFRNKTRNKVLCKFGEKEYWNFHEWVDGLNGHPTFRDFEIEEHPDALLTALLYRAAKGASELEKMVGNEALATDFANWANDLAEGIMSFYDEEKRLFASYIENGKLTGYHEYTQALILTTGILNKEITDRLCYVLMNGDENMLPITPAGLPMKYEGLLANCDSAEYIKNDICEVFGEMIFQGATSYWETVAGVDYGGGAGSLCHAWSAAACYALDTIYINQTSKK